MSNRFDISPADLDAALMLAATKELSEGMGAVYLTLNDYIPINELVRSFYPKMSAYEKRRISNCLKDYNPNVEAVIVRRGTVKIFPLQPQHIAARKQIKDNYVTN